MYSHIQRNFSDKKWYIVEIDYRGIETISRGGYMSKKAALQAMETLRDNETNKTFMKRSIDNGNTFKKE